MKDFTIGEMFAFLEQVHSGKLGNDFCSSMCEHRNEECKECLYYDATYLRKILAMPISHKAMDYIKRNGEECDSSGTNERRRKDEERSE